jgi:tRNA(Ser,Leu) C12 N-acetylase TAN1
MSTPTDWNVVVTTYDREFRTAMRLLRPFGSVAPTDFRNVFVMRVDDVLVFLRSVEQRLLTDASIANSVARISPVTARFDFASAEEFEREALRVAAPWLHALGGSRFHVRVHRRGCKGRLSSQHEEQVLGRHLLQMLEQRGATATVDLDDSDFTIIVETLDRAAGAAIWTRAQLREFQLLRFD